MRPPSPFKKPISSKKVHSCPSVSNDLPCPTKMKWGRRPKPRIELKPSDLQKARKVLFIDLLCHLAGAGRGAPLPVVRLRREEWVDGRYAVFLLTISYVFRWL